MIFDDFGPQKVNKKQYFYFFKPTNKFFDWFLDPIILLDQIILTLKKILTAFGMYLGHKTSNCPRESPNELGYFTGKYRGYQIINLL